MIKTYLHELYAGIVNGWNRFWFTPTDPATLGLMRILGGSMLFYTHLVWSIDLTGFMGEQGRFSADLVDRMHQGSEFAFSYLWLFDGNPAMLWMVHIAALVILLMFTLGFYSRITSVLAFIIAVSYAHRAPGALFGLDQVNVMLAMYMMLGGAGEAYSLDRLIEKWRYPNRQLPKTSTAANVSIRLIQLHMCVIYLFAGTGKLLGDTWWEGTAMWGAVANSEYQSMDMTWLASYPLLIALLTQVSLAWELSYSALVWPRLTRPLVIFMAIPLHLGIALCMGMVTFGLAMLIANMAFISPWIIRELESGIRHKLAKEPIAEAT
ncbi:HTTM domain-containing protein [Blastopirellula marina]|uniref:HTTM domain-containing protein n=1 Tax=Blastopirellula marina TaxID=124 RepID=A0A2S8FAQ8_9BACT|nr:MULTISPECIES: HTTM domain-containing protein [Pirellulaceae]PQO29258.1 HTTM domain-containing protein [Blastopirellula marina]RCS50451.1 HTTM domain-containing protein [Bremerella cremea]